MATETGRIVKRKRIKMPSGGTLDIPVISQISFLDPNDRGQETAYTIDNTTDADRSVRVASVPGNGQPTDETGETNGLKVERIDRFKLADASDRGWEIFPEPDSKTVAQPPDAPPYFTTHAKTHLVKYIARNADDSDNPSFWIKSELIDAWSFVDGSDRGQETQFALFNPPDNQDIDGLRIGTDQSDHNITTISVDPSLEEITTGVGGSEEGDAPVRTDPFQNIVDWNGQTITYIWRYRATSIAFLPGGSGNDFTQYVNFYPWQGLGILSGHPVPIDPTSDFVLTGGPIVNGIAWPGTQPWLGTAGEPNGEPAEQALMSWPFHFGTLGVDETTPGGPPGLYLAGAGFELQTGDPYVTIRTHHDTSGSLSLSHTWQFEALKFAEIPTSGYINTGTLTTSIGNLILKVKGAEWDCTSLSIFMASAPVKPDPYDPVYAGYGLSPFENPIFVATFGG